MNAFIKVFAKSQVSAFVGGLVDYGIMLICTELFGIHYTLSIVIGGIIGAVVNYAINRNWAFDAIDGKKSAQIPKFIIVALGTIFLKSSGTFLCTEYLQIDYKFSRIIVDIFVAFGFNFVLQKFWVFKKR